MTTMGEAWRKMTFFGDAKELNSCSNSLPSLCILRRWIRRLILTAGAGAFALARIFETEGVYLGEAGLSVEEVRDNWGRIADETGQRAYVTGAEQTQKFFRKLGGE